MHNKLLKILLLLSLLLLLLCHYNYAQVIGSITFALTQMFARSIDRCILNHTDIS